MQASGRGRPVSGVVQPLSSIHAFLARVKVAQSACYTSAVAKLTHYGPFPSARSTLSVDRLQRLDLSAGHFSWWDKSEISPGADTFACARPAAWVKAGRLAARAAGRLDGGA
jgi:hypothetical protein